MSCSCAENYAKLVRDVGMAKRVFDLSPEIRDELAPRWVEFVSKDLERINQSCPISVFSAKGWVEEAEKAVREKDYLDADTLLVKVRENVMKSIVGCADEEERARKAGKLREWLGWSASGRKYAPKP